MNDWDKPRYAPQGRGWSKDEIDQLTKMWNVRGLSAREIGQILGRPKNSIIGKAHRLKLDQRQTGYKKHERTKQVPLGKKVSMVDVSHQAVLDAYLKRNGLR